jgi:hypothetical protein
MSNLRSFSSFANVAPVVVYAFPVGLSDLGGYSAGAGYLQIFDLEAAPQAGAVPSISLPVLAAGPLPSLYETLGVISMKVGLTVAFSSTKNTYTAVATAFDLYGNVDEFEANDVTNGTTLGSSGAGAANYDVWASDGVTQPGPYKLVKLTVAPNATAASQYLQIFPAALATNAIPFFGRKLPANGVTLTLNFGAGGITPFNQAAGKVITNGCYIGISSDATKYVGVQNATFTLSAWYK